MPIRKFLCHPAYEGHYQIIDLDVSLLIIQGWQKSMEDESSMSDF